MPNTSTVRSRPPAAGRDARPGRRGGTVLMLLLLLAGAACARTPAPSPAAAAAPAPLLLRSADLRLPLDAYLASTAEVAELGRGYRALVHRCMARYGFDFPPATAPAPAGPLTRNERRYGLTDRATAAAFGYRLAGDATGPARPDLPDLPAVARAALTGEPRQPVAGRPVPAGGCTDQANRELSAGDPPGADTGVPDQLAAESFTRSLRDPRVEAVIRQWATCMHAGGYRYDTPLAPAADPRFRGTLSRAETGTAVADVDCKRRTNLVGVWFTVESEYQRALIRDHAAALALAAAAVRAQLEVASGSQP